MGLSSFYTSSECLHYILYRIKDVINFEKPYFKKRSKPFRAEPDKEDVYYRKYYRKQTLKYVDPFKREMSKYLYKLIGLDESYPIDPTFLFSNVNALTKAINKAKIIELIPASGIMLSTGLRR